MRALALKVLPALVLATIAVVPVGVRATPSTIFWAPSTPAVQAFGVMHLTYDTYFSDRAAYPIDLGATVGVLPWMGLQAEAGFDLLYPSVAGAEAIELPIVLNGKVGAPEDVYFRGQPAWALGAFGVGFESGSNDQHVLYGVLGKTLPHIGMAQVGAYYGLTEERFRSAAGQVNQSGLLAGWSSPAIDAPLVDKIVLAWDVQTGDNVLGATGGGVSVYFTPTIALLTGPVFFFEEELQPGGSSWSWSVQLDVDIDFSPDGGRRLP